MTRATSEEAGRGLCLPGQRRAAAKAAREAWKSAPVHVKLMAGAYVEPLLKAIDAISADMDHKEGPNGNHP